MSRFYFGFEYSCISKSCYHFTRRCILIKEIYWKIKWLYQFWTSIGKPILVSFWWSDTLLDCLIIRILKPSSTTTSINRLFYFLVLSSFNRARLLRLLALTGKNIAQKMPAGTTRYITINATITKVTASGSALSVLLIAVTLSTFSLVKSSSSVVVNWMSDRSLTTILYLALS